MSDHYVSALQPFRNKDDARELNIIICTKYRKAQSERSIRYSNGNDLLSKQ